MGKRHGGNHTPKIMNKKLVSGESLFTFCSVFGKSWASFWSSKSLGFEVWDRDVGLKTRSTFKAICFGPYFILK